MYTNYQTIITSSNSFVDGSDNDKVSKIGDVIVPASGETAIDISRASEILSNGIILGGDLNVISPNNDIIGEFLAYYLSFGNRKYKIARLAQGKTIVHIHNSDLKKLEINYPKVEEQQKIVNYFSNLDQLIKLQSKKLEHLKSDKQGYLQKMFPSKDSEKPRLRFNIFNDNWSCKKLDNYLSKPNNRKANIHDLNDIMTLKLHLQGLVKSSNRDTLSLKATNYYVRHSGQLIYGKQNFFYGSVAIIPEKFNGLATSQDVPSLNIHNINDGYLLNYISRKPFFYYSKRFAIGTGSKRLHEKELLHLKIKVPSFNEQKSISKFFSHLDHLINLQQQKIDHLKKLKQAYLQKMFV